MLSTIYSPPNAERLVELIFERERLQRQRMEVQLPMPSWALPPLLEVGLSRQEIRVLEQESDPVHRRERLRKLDRELAFIDSEIEGAEPALLGGMLSAQDDVVGFVRLAIRHMRLICDGDRSPQPGDARILDLLERAADALEQQPDDATPGTALKLN